MQAHRLCVGCRSLKKDAKLKEKKSNAWKQRQGEQKQQQAKKQKRYALGVAVFAAISATEVGSHACCPA